MSKQIDELMELADVYYATTMWHNSDQNRATLREALEAALARKETEALREAIEQVGEQDTISEKRKQAMQVYTPPFRYLRGYIYDSKNNMVADNGDITGNNNVKSAVAARVRGWGRLAYMTNGAEIQDEIGQMIADALNTAYTQPAKPLTAEQVFKAIEHAEKHPFVICGEYETQIEALTREADFYKQLYTKANRQPPVTQEITRLRSIIEDMELKLDVKSLVTPTMTTHTARYTLCISADSGYKATIDGQCTPHQYSMAIAALKGAPHTSQGLQAQRDELMAALKGLLSVASSLDDPHIAKFDAARAAIRKAEVSA